MCVEFRLTTCVATQVIAAAKLLEQKHVKNEHLYDISFSKHDEKLLNLITKYLLLVILANISTVLLLTYWGLEVSIKLPFFTQTFLSFDNLINILSLYLQFAFGNKLYQILCTPCHKWIKSQMTQWTLSKIKRKHAKITTEKQAEIILSGIGDKNSLNKIASSNSSNINRDSMASLEIVTSRSRTSVISDGPSSNYSAHGETEVISSPSMASIAE